MSTVLIINAHQPYPFSPGRLNGTYADTAAELLATAGWTVLRTHVAEGWDVDEELAKHAQSDVVLVQSPVNWMGVSWSFKKYMDEVYTAGMDGRLCEGDGRSRHDPGKQYGTSGTQRDLRYMLSLTLNAPADAFGDEEAFFEGRSVDDLFWPMHLNFKFFGMQRLPTFASFDVMKNAQVETDIARFRDHVDEHLIGMAPTRTRG